MPYTVIVPSPFESSCLLDNVFSLKPINARRRGSLIRVLSIPYAGVMPKILAEASSHGPKPSEFMCSSVRIPPGKDTASRTLTCGPRLGFNGNGIV